MNLTLSRQQKVFERLTNYYRRMRESKLTSSKSAMEQLYVERSDLFINTASWMGVCCLQATTLNKHINLPIGSECFIVYDRS